MKKKVKKVLILLVFEEVFQINNLNKKNKFKVRQNLILKREIKKIWINNFREVDFKEIMIMMILIYSPQQKI